MDGERARGERWFAINLVASSSVVLAQHAEPSLQALIEGLEGRGKSHLGA